MEERGGLEAQCPGGVGLRKDGHGKDKIIESFLFIRQIRLFVIVLSSPTFEFSSKVTENIIKELDRAEVFIKIAMFQIHRSEIFEVLKKKLNQGVKVEIITLPYDSIKEKIRNDVQKRFEDLEKHGAIIYFCKWNIGDPSRTTTAVGRWYSFHGKMIITDKCSIALTANFTEDKELDAAIIFRDDENKKEEFIKKFEFLLRLFIIPEGKNTGTIKNKILEITRGDKSLFELPSDIPESHREFWITDYPEELCPIPKTIEEGLYIAPFDCRGRDMFEKVIEEANEFVYLSTETFTDPDFSVFLIKTALNKNLDLRIICGIYSMDFNDRVNDMIRELLAQGIKIKSPDEKLHGKLLVTEKAVVVSSINLNKISLGFSRNKHLWRGNTETILITKDKNLIANAKKNYLEVFNLCNKVEDKLSEKLEEIAKEILGELYQLKPNPEARALFAKLVLKHQINAKKFPIQLGNLTNLLVRKLNKISVTKNDIISALILYILSESKQSFNQLQEKIKEFDEETNINTVLFSLESYNLITQENEFYKLNLQELLKGGFSDL